MLVSNENDYLRSGQVDWFFAEVYVKAVTVSKIRSIMPAGNEALDAWNENEPSWNLTTDEQHVTVSQLKELDLTATS